MVSALGNELLSEVAEPSEAVDSFRGGSGGGLAIFSVRTESRRTLRETQQSLVLLSQTANTIGGTRIGLVTSLFDVFHFKHTSSCMCPQQARPVTREPFCSCIPLQTYGVFENNNQLLLSTYGSKS